jgi:hypothetical protein
MAFNEQLFWTQHKLKIMTHLFKQKGFTMKTTILLILLIAASLPAYAQYEQPVQHSGNIRMLVIVAENYGLNTFLNKTNFEQFGWDITYAGVTNPVAPCPWAATSFGIHDMDVDSLISDIDDIAYYDIVAIMPATKHVDNPFGDLLGSTETINLLQEADSLDKIIWATCSGVRVLAAANIIQGCDVTGAEEFQSEYTGAGANYVGKDSPPVICGNIITTVKGRYYEKQNCEIISTLLETKSVSR